MVILVWPGKESCEKAIFSLDGYTTNTGLDPAGA